jgi:uncharacterized protein YqgV (UPF0045/DUF77 family)
VIASAQVSVYPLRQDHLSPSIEAVRGTLEARGLHAEVGAMNTTLTGEPDLIFAALGEAFRKAASMGDVVMTVTVSNACPLPR